MADAVRTNVYDPSDITRQKALRALTDAEVAQIGAIKTAGANFIHFLDSLGASRDLSLSKTKMEEAVMWGVKHVTR